MNKSIWTQIRVPRVQFESWVNAIMRGEIAK